MSNQNKIKTESRQQSNQKTKIQNVFSTNSLATINKVNTEKKIFKDLSLNFIKNFISTTLTNKTCVNHSHKKIVIKEKSRLHNNRKIDLHLNNQNKFIKFPLKLNYKQSISLKNLIEEENILSDKRKNTNTKIELFSTNSTLSFLNIKDNTKEASKPIKIKCFDYNNSKKNFSSTFIEKKIRQKSKSNTNIKVKHIKSNLSLDKKLLLDLQKKKHNKNNNYKENTFNTSNKSIEFCMSYMKPINKRRNLSLGINENSNSNTNSIKELYKMQINPNKMDSSNILLDNMSFSLNKNANKENGLMNRCGYTVLKKININTYCNPNSINNNTKKKFNLSCLPNLLCNNYMSNHNFTLSTKDLFNLKDKNKKIQKHSKNKSSYQNLLEQKKIKKNYIKIKKIDYKNHNSKVSFKKINNRDNNNYNDRIREIKYNNNNNHNNEQLKNIHNGVKSLLDGLYNIYLNANNTNINMINVN